jgi:hypothetical protein
MDRLRPYETTVLRKPDGRIRAWVRHSVIHIGERWVRFYTAFVWNYGMDHELIMDDFGNLVQGDAHALMQ